MQCAHPAWYVMTKWREYIKKAHLNTPIRMRYLMYRPIRFRLVFRSALTFWCQRLLGWRIVFFIENLCNCAIIVSLFFVISLKGVLHSEKVTIWQDCKKSFTRNITTWVTQIHRENLSFRSNGIVERTTYYCSKTSWNLCLMVISWMGFKVWYG